MSPIFTSCKGQKSLVSVFESVLKIVDPPSYLTIFFADMQAGIIGGAVLKHLMAAPVLPAPGALLLVLPEVCTGM